MVDISSYVGYSYRQHGKESLCGRFLANKIDINYRINLLIEAFLQKENVADRQHILDGRLLECLLAYEKELVVSPLPWKEKKNLFYEKYGYYKRQLAKPQRLAHRIIVWAGEHCLCYPLVYLFRLKG